MGKTPFMRLPKNYLRWKGRTIACGERAIVTELRMPGHPANKLVARVENFEPKRPQEPTKEMFHKYRLASILFPKHFLQPVAVAPPNRNMHGPVLLSKLVKLDALSQKVIEMWYDGNYGFSAVDRKFGRPEFTAHEKRVREIAVPIAKEMGRKGIVVNMNPLNVWFSKEGAPIFFDILKIDPSRLPALSGQKASDSIKFLKRQNS